MTRFSLAIFALCLLGALAFRAAPSRSAVGRRGDVRMMGKPVTVTFLPSNKVVEAEQGDLIQTVAQKAGVKIKFDCKTGRCGTCEVRLNNRVTAKVCQGAKIPAGPTKALKIEPKTK
mmetsp:Transcript_23529/g.32605  ORF Transcript_23529/g.32605 Transcript_23529/m.32605 type:complete len:117 (-) Transcript_23529:296-646(-)